MNATDSPSQSLQQLGFTGLEAEVYVYLLQHPPATGYRIAQGVGKTKANTYKALESLLSKGAVLVDDGESRVWRAVPSEELLAHLGRSYSRAADRAAAALNGLGNREFDARVYQLHSREQALERARRMLARAQWVALVDLDPTIVPELAPELEAAARRGVRVVVKLYAPATLAGVETIERVDGQRLTDALPSDPMGLSIDGTEFLSAQLSPNGGPPIQAIWTASPILAYEAYHSLMYQLILTEVQQAIWDGAGNRSLRRVLEGFEDLHPIRAKNPVFHRFLSALGGTPSNPEDGSEGPGEPSP